MISRSSAAASSSVSSKFRGSRHRSLRGRRPSSRGAGEAIACDIVLSDRRRNSLPRPGGNATGISILNAELLPKRIELISELVPQGAMIRDVEEVARARGMQLPLLKAGSETEIEAAFATLLQLQAHALVIGTDSFYLTRRDQLVTLAARYSVPAIYEWREFVVMGGLISYGASVTAPYRQAGVYVGRILKGAKPADLPVEQPMKFEMAVNLKTATILSLAVPQTILARADEVIE